jgi:cytochrome P450
MPQAKTSAASVHWDPYNQEYFADPYPMLRRMRENAPLYYNEEYDFYALSLYDDCVSVLSDRDSYTSARGTILEMIKKGVPIPSFMFIFEDAPLHTIHRSLLARGFTPKRMAALENEIRKFCALALDPLKGGEEFDFITHLGSEMPMRVIGLLLGMPEHSLKEAQRLVEESMRAPEPGKPRQNSGDSFAGAAYEDYIDWRRKNPSDDMITELFSLEYKDAQGETKKLTRAEVLTLINLLFAAGNETTNRLIGWTGKLLSEHPEQRRAVGKDRALIPQVIEEVLRYESPGPYIGRVTTREVEFHGVKVPAGKPLLSVVAAANRDESKFPNGETFDIHRERHPHLTFGYGFHNCIGNALARVEGRLALEEVLNRFPNWEVDMSRAKMSPTTAVRGWDTLPAFIT